MKLTNNSENVWKFTIIYEHLCTLMNIFEHIWTCMNTREVTSSDCDCTPHGLIYADTVTGKALCCEHLWTLINTYEHLRTLMNIYEQFWTFTNTYEHWWVSMNTHEHPRSKSPECDCTLHTPTGASYYAEIQSQEKHSVVNTYAHW